MKLAEDKFLRWFERHPQIFEQEKVALLSVGFRLDEQRLKNDELVVFHGRLTVDPDRELAVWYPNTFPSSGPSVFDSASRPLLQRHHQPRTREFCLFGVGRSGWRASMSGTDALEQVAALISDFSEGAKLPEDDHVPEPLSATLPDVHDIVIIVPPSVALYQKAVEKLTEGSVILRHERSGSPGHPAQGMVLNLQIDGTTFSAVDPYRNWPAARGELVNCTALQIPGSPTAATLRSAMQTHFASAAGRKLKHDQWLAVLFHEQTGTKEQRRLAWLFVRQKRSQAPKIVRGYLYRPDERQARLPQLAALHEKKVMIVGCGCLGSKIAVGLAASGVQQFALVDFDIYEPNNAVRNEIGVSGFGHFKADLLLGRLMDINPEVKGIVLHHHIGGIQSMDEERMVMEQLGGANIVVDSTGKHSATRWLNERTFEARVPAVVVSVTNGAWSGEVVRTIPRKTPCWMCWLDEYYDDPPPGDPTGTLFAPGCDQPSFTGTTYDCGVVASFATAMIVSTLLRDDPTSTAFGGDYLRWSARDKEGNSLLKMEVGSFKAREGCAVCRSEA